jgi:hypothetical protein
LDPVDEASVERIVQNETGLPQERARWIARKTRGYVKLAVLVARAVSRGTTSIDDMRSDFEVAALVQNVLSSNERQRDALRGIALLARVGYDGEVAAEGEAVAAFLGIGWNDFRNALGNARTEGIVVQRGRYLYVSPELLAIWLSGEFWRGQPKRIIELLDSLPTLPSRQAFIERLASLRDIPDVERVVAEKLLGPFGPFQTLADISTDSTSRLFSALAKGHYRASIGTLQRIVGGADDEALLAFRTGRQEIVWTLRSLLERRDTFFAAARLLRRLAETENETRFSNNATDYWNNAFLILLGQTETPAMERLPLIDESLAAPNKAVRLLGVSALSTMLQTQEHAGIEESDSSVPPQHWQPTSWMEVREIKRAALDRLGPLLEDTDRDVAERARANFLRDARGLVQLGLADAVIDLLRRLDVSSDDERRRLWIAARTVLLSKDAFLNDSQRGALEELASRCYNDSLRDRMRRYLGPGSIAVWDEADFQKDREDQVIAHLADEANESDEWINLLPWLFSGEAHNLHPFAWRLGQVDAGRKWFDPFLERAMGAADPRLLTIYLAGWASLDHEQLVAVDRVLDEWSIDRSRASLVADATLRGAPSSQAATRLLFLVDKGWIQPGFLGWLRSGSWMPKLPDSLIKQIIDRLTADGSPESIQAGMALAARIANDSPARFRRSYRSVAWRLIESPGARAGTDQSDYLWQELGKRLVEFDKKRMLRLFAEMFANEAPSYEDQRLPVLLTAARTLPREALNILAPAILTGPARHGFHWALRDAGFFEQLDPAAVQDWVFNYGDPAVDALVESIRVEAGELSPIVRYLLVDHFERVDGPIAAQFISGGWSGSEAAYLATKLASVRVWAEDRDPNVRRWATSLITWLEQSITRSRQREEEEWWR